MTLYPLRGVQSEVFPTRHQGLRPPSRVVQLAVWYTRPERYFDDAAREMLLEMALKLLDW